MKHNDLNVKKCLNIYRHYTFCSTNQTGARMMLSCSPQRKSEVYAILFLSNEKQ